MYWTILLIGGWTLGGILRYASGPLIAVPGARNNLNTFNLRPSGTRMNRVSGQTLFLKDPNCGCIDPTKDLVLNPAAWADPAQGEWGFSSAYYNDFRWQRQATENLSIGRTFPIRGGRMFFSIRAEFFNAFDRLQVGTGQLSAGNPLATPTTTPKGQLSGGFGFINFSSVGGQRNGQLVARFQF